MLGVYHSLSSLKADLFYQLSLRQRSMVNRFVGSYDNLEFIDMKDFLKITKKERLIVKLQYIKRKTVRLVA